MLLQELRRRIEKRDRERLLYSLFPDDGPLRRDLYPKHMAFYEAGREHQERALLGGNRTGKSLGVGFEVVCHLVGWYPAWWLGRKYKRPVTAWICGEDVKAMRESIQPTYFGAPEALGTGLIPAESLIGKPTARSGVPEAYDSATIKHSSGGVSRAVLKSYDQGRESYQGAKIDIGVCDEEPPAPIYSEILTRTMATVPGEENGMLLSAFTPLKGVSETVLKFLPGGVIPVTEELRRTAWGW